MPASVSTAPTTALAPRERILATAARLFYAQGVRATGIDQIIAEAVVAKATLYYHFPAKTDLVRAYLARRHDAWLGEFSAHLAKSRRRGLPALADALGRWFESGDFNGCAFINVTAESAEDEWRQISCAHKGALRELIAGRLDPALSPARRAALSAQALLVVEGLIVRYQMTRDAAVVDEGRALLASSRWVRTRASTSAASKGFTM
ncbi:MAG: TetR/AcrR family transcriptional regulator [Burkholderiales bacterium]|nr:TetR/AcrR family transcriptional regulator [Opitutaceae bacterium]